MRRNGWRKKTFPPHTYTDSIFYDTSSRRTLDLHIFSFSVYCHLRLTPPPFSFLATSYHPISSSAIQAERLRQTPSPPVSLIQENCNSHPARHKIKSMQQTPTTIAVLREWQDGNRKTVTSLPDGESRRTRH